VCASSWQGLQGINYLDQYSEPILIVDVKNDAHDVDAPNAEQFKLKASG
jgi:hypothetical protein